MDTKRIGTIIKGYSGFYYVDIGDKVIACSLRGKNRLKNTDFLPGDKAEIEIIDYDKATGVVNKTLKRKNSLLRPQVANIDQVVITSSLKNPVPDFMLIDRLTIIAGVQGISPVLIFNKLDIAETGLVEEIKDIYRVSEYPMLFVSAEDQGTKEQVRQELIGILENKISIVAGISGVGKTSLINLLGLEQELKVGEISRKLKRGRHTTRHTELLQITKDSWIADSPGFSSLEFPDTLSAAQIPKVYPDFLKYDHLCKFNNCMHIKEPGCEIKKQLEAGGIHQKRYQNYMYFIEEIKSREERRY